MTASRLVRYCRTRISAALILATPLILGACDEIGNQSAGVVETCAPDGFLTTRLYGAMPVELNWQADDLTCAGMPRPAGEGARIRLAGPLDDAPGARTVAFILGLPDLQRGRTAREVATNITFMEEGTGRFFGTADTSGCWTDVDLHAPIDDGAGSTYRIGGTVYCVSPLAELNGASSISFNELTFSARLNWEQAQ